MIGGAVIELGRSALERVGALPARPVFAVLHIGGGASGIASFFHRPIDPNHAIILACTPAAIVAVLAVAVAIRAVRRGY